MKTFYRVGDINTKQGLWYDQAGQFTGFIHGPLNFCANSELQMPFDAAIIGYLSATETLEELFVWFPITDIEQLEKYGFSILEYQAADFKQYANHWIINQQTSIIVKVIEVKTLQHHA